MSRGSFITFEGGEGSGKSTQIRLLSEELARRNIRHRLTREPGGSPGGEEIRRLLVTGGAERWSPLSETLLFYAARVDHWDKVIEPALGQGQHVICDRFADSTLAYQAYAGGMDRELVRRLHKLVMGEAEPDLTIILDLDPEAGLARAAARPGAEARFESKGLAFHQRLRNGFLAIARENSKRCRVIDAQRPISEVAADVLRIILAHLKLD